MALAGKTLRCRSGRWRSVLFCPRFKLQTAAHASVHPSALPARRDRPPKGDEWLHEVKFDGYRIQLQKAGEEARILSKNGHNFSNRFPGLIAQLKY